MRVGGVRVQTPTPFAVIPSERSESRDLHSYRLVLRGDADNGQRAQRTALRVEIDARRAAPLQPRPQMIFMVWRRDLCTRTEQIRPCPAHPGDPGPCVEQLTQRSAVQVSPAASGQRRADSGQQQRRAVSHPAFSAGSPFKIRVPSFFAASNERETGGNSQDQNALNSSNGCPQERHQQIDLHAVDPNSLRVSVSGESQKGHGGARRARRS